MDSQTASLIAREGTGEVTFSFVALLVVFDGAFNAQKIVLDTLWDL